MQRINLTERTQAPASPIRIIFQQIPIIDKERKAQGLEPIINLSIGQPHLPPNPAVLAKLKEELESKEISFNYSPSQGREQTLDAIVRLYNHYYPMTEFSKEEVMVTNGASEALWNAFSIIIDKNAIVLTFEPYFSTYRSQIQALGGKLKMVPTLKNQFRPDADVLDKMLQLEPNAKMVILNYPNNPTGVSLTIEEATALAKVLSKYPQVAIVIDDVYRDLNYKKHYTVLDVDPSLKERSIMINSGAKGLVGLVGAPDMRIGMASANPKWITAMCQQQLFAISGVPYLTQSALIYAVNDYLLNSTNQWLAEVNREYKNNIDSASAELDKYGLTTLQKPDGAFYLFVNAKQFIGKEVPIELGLKDKLGTNLIRSDVDMVNYFIHAAGVATVPGSAFGVNEKEGYIRISCAKDNKVLLKAVKQMGEATQLLKEPKLVLVHELPSKTAVSQKSMQGWSKKSLLAGIGLVGMYLTYSLFANNKDGSSSSSLSSSVCTPNLK